ncbi:hypothetical protein FQN55_007137 [Onygenales sp. PD_40]|nr:hypothetical protein FQN55_007137 [Onygenales sp. PD_40]
MLSRATIPAKKSWMSGRAALIAERSAIARMIVGFIRAKNVATHKMRIHHTVSRLERRVRTRFLIAMNLAASLYDANTNAPFRAIPGHVHPVFYEYQYTVDAGRVLLNPFAIKV